MKKVTGVIFGVLFIITVYLHFVKGTMALQYAAIAELGVCLTCFLPAYKHKAVSRERLSKRIIPAALAAFVAVPLTIAAGIYLFGNRKYYFISLLIILEIMIPFFAGFEKKHPRGREIVIISVLCAMAIAGRTAFYFLPQFKPVLAIIIIAGACLGSETGFIVGAITGFVSNFFFGQGPWTPWQMFAFGIIGFIAGIIFRCGLIKPNRITLSIFGAFATIVIFGGIMNPSSVLQWQAHPSAEMFISAYAVALPFDILHAFATAFFLWFISEPVMEKLERVKIKYGILKNES